MNNLLFEKIWEDADFYQIIVKALAKNISAETKVYVTKENIIALSDLIKNLIDKHHSEFYWEIGDTDLSAESFFSIGLLNTIISDTISSVSYTHLDVYKRQL